MKVPHPRYMVLLRKLSVDKRTKAYERYNFREKREYYIGEGLTLVRSGKEEALLNQLVLSPEMRTNPYEITFEQMIDYLMTQKKKILC